MVGPSIQRIESSYVIFNSRQFRRDTPIQAVDTLFKLHYALHVEYSPVCFDAFRILQEVVYKLEGQAQRKKDSGGYSALKDALTK